VTVVRHGTRTQALGWVLAGVGVFLLAADMVLLGLNTARVDTGRVALNAILGVAILAYTGAGRLITSRRPGNAVGWLLGLIGVTIATSTFAEQYALYGLATARGSVPGARSVGALAGAAAELTVILLLFLILLFPDGRLPSRRWRPVVWALFVVAAAWVTQSLQAGTKISGGLTNALVAANVTYPNPLGFLPRHGWYSDLLKLSFVLGIVTGVLVIASVFVRRRGASYELRRQLAWLGYVGALTILWAAVLAVASEVAPGPANSWLGTVIWSFWELTPVAGIPVACAVAVMKYRLYEIDKIISRTLAYAIVTGLLVGVYAGLVLLATEVLTIKSPVAVAAATLAAAALFTPLRSRVQHLVDRKFNRTRYDADQTLTAFAARLKDAVDQDAVRADLLGVVHRSLEPTHAAVWLRPVR
jgi:hypothetical protein